MADADLHELIQGAQPDSLGRDSMGMRWTPKGAPMHIDTGGAGRFHLIGGRDNMREVPCDCPKRRRWFRRSD